MYFTPEAKNEVIRETVSHKSDRTIVNPSNKFWRDSTQTKNPTSTFQIVDSLICRKLGTQLYGEAGGYKPDIGITIWQIVTNSTIYYILKLVTTF